MVRWALQALIEAEATAVIGAAPHQRTTWRNGHRERLLTTAPGNIELKIPKLRASSFFPSLLERRRRIDQDLFAVVMEAYLHGVSTRAVDELVQALGADTGLSKSEVSRICKDLDTEVALFRDRPLSHTVFPYVSVNATYCKARVNHRVISQAVVIATGVSADGRREILGFDVGDSEDGPFWTAFLRSLKSSGLAGVQLVVSDAYTGLVGALRSVLLGAAWQRCQVHVVTAIAVERNDCPKCEAPTGSPCRTRSGKCATKYHTASFILVSALREELEVIVPEDRGPGRRGKRARPSRPCSTPRRPSPASTMQSSVRAMKLTDVGGRGVQEVRPVEDGADLDPIGPEAETRRCCCQVYASSIPIRHRVARHVARRDNGHGPSGSTSLLGEHQAGSAKHHHQEPLRAARPHEVRRRRGRRDDPHRQNDRPPWAVADLSEMQPDGRGDIAFMEDPDGVDPEPEEKPACRRRLTVSCSSALRTLTTAV